MKKKEKANQCCNCFYVTQYSHRTCPHCNAPMLKEGRLNKEQKKIQELHELIRKLNSANKDANNQHSETLKQRDAHMREKDQAYEQLNRKSRDFDHLTGEVLKAADLLALNLNQATSGHALGILDASLRICAGIDRTRKEEDQQNDFHSPQYFGRNNRHG